MKFISCLSMFTSNSTRVYFDISFLMSMENTMPSIEVCFLLWMFFFQWRWRVFDNAPFAWWWRCITSPIFCMCVAFFLFRLVNIFPFLVHKSLLGIWSSVRATNGFCVLRPLPEAQQGCCDGHAGTVKWPLRCLHCVLRQALSRMQFASQTWF